MNFELLDDYNGLEMGFISNNSGGYISKNKYLFEKIELTHLNQFILEQSVFGSPIFLLGSGISIDEALNIILNSNQNILVQDNLKTVQNLVKQGFDALSDINDRKGTAQDPLIILNMDKINQTGSVKLTKDDLKYYADYTMTKEIKKKKKDLSSIQR